MTSEQPSPRLTEPLPGHARLFHIGPPKTGTTSLQAAAAVSRAALLEHGVRYPGRERSQRTAVAAFLGRAVQYSADPNPPAAPRRAAWDVMMREVRADPTRRAWFGHEYAASASPEQVAGFAQAIGPGLHVVVTLRSFTTMLPSVWQEYNKAGSTSTFDGFVKRTFRLPEAERAGSKFHIRHDHAALVRRWADVVGVDNLTVVIADRHDHSFLMTAFEDLLDLPRGLLAGAEVPSRAANRGMSTPEIEFVRTLNLRLREEGLPWREYEALMVHGGLSGMLSNRRPGPAEPSLRLTPWAAKQADAYQARIVDGLLASGVRMIGDVENLREPARVRESPAQNHAGQEAVPIDAAVELAVGVIEAATRGGGPDGGWRALPGRIRDSLAAGGVRGLAAAASRYGRQLSRRWS
ncbi:hypothetical protein [Propionicimonas sp.]|uniref:hypothetical protein n=1 Tax=Propionicimonas sp. TaxID=1955623 RepID=UPI0039E6EE0E